ncbi:DUF1629 domain-containing protein [uncultured Dokdonia sp.]|uniref:imm11 family protein n=1 Tax=uncultured Dokdonia sp. TaxID=575653 RepID=UPI0026091090|nr:DUF1629 domain-containing protein [uncultured Dokdonia sp.]
MTYYKINHEIETNDIYISFEHATTLNNLVNGKGTKLDKINYEGNEPTDFYSLEGFAISKKAKDVFLSLNLPYLTFIPYTFYSIDSEQPLEIFLMKIENEINCIDYEESDLFILGDRIRRIKKLVFDPSFHIKEPCIFYLKGSSKLFINDEFKKIIIKNNLKGFEFIPVSEYKS